MQSDIEKQADTTSRVKEDTAAIRETGADHTTTLSALTSEARMQLAFREKVNSAEDSKNKREVLEWLSDLDFSKQQQSHVLNHTQGTGLWLLADSTFQHWKDGFYSRLCCLGMPGAGKTVMSAVVIRHLSQISLNSVVNVAVAFVYFKYDERGTQSTACIIGGLVKQLLSQTRSIPQFINEAFEKRTHAGFQTPYQDMLQAAVETFKIVYLVIDALDEADSSTVRDLISAIRVLPRDKVRLLVTSRPIPEVQSQFDGDKAIEIRASDEDILSYARSRLPELPNSVKSSRDLQEKVVQAIVQSTRGMFLLAKLNMDSLKDKRRRSALIKALEDLPSGQSAYGDAYDNAMSRISNQSEDDQELARQVLTWVVYAKRPLTKMDLETALAVEVGKWTLDPDNVVSISELVSLCAGLVIVEESRYREEARIVRLVHYTAQEYFSRNEHYLLRNPHRVLSNVCITYLGLEDFTGEFAYQDFIDHVTWHEPDRVLSSHAARYPFLRYAAEHWENHCEAALPFANDDEERHTLSLDLRLLTHPNLMESYLRVGGKWVDVRDILGARTGNVRFCFRLRTGIQYAAGKGNYWQVSALLGLGHNPNDESYGTTPLFEAARGLHENVVRLLIDYKANVHPALSAAILSQPRKSNNQAVRTEKRYMTSGHALESMVLLLLEAGADPNYTTTARRLKTALMYAAERGLDRIIAKLCGVGAGMNCRDRRGWTALLCAVQCGHERVVKQLLQCGCDPNIPDTYTRTPADFALSTCNWTILEMLLDTGKIAFDREAYNNGNILGFACGIKGCPVSLLRRIAVLNRNLLDARLKGYLLDTGMEVYHNTPLTRAAKARNADAMEVLLELGADVHLTNTDGETALHVVAKLDDDPQNVPIAMMRALLRAKMDVDAKTLRGVTALMLACKTGDIKRVELLLEEGASVLLTNDKGWSPLTFATRGGHSDIVTRLLRTSTLQQIDLDRALMMASARGYCNVIRVLTNAGVSSNTAAEDQTTALMSAAKGGHFEAARLLIEKGTAVNARKAETALVCLMRTELEGRASLNAPPYGVQDILPMLLERGLDVNASTVDGDTALLLATDPRYPHSDDARLLLEAGANPVLTERCAEIALISSYRIRSMDFAVLELILDAGVDPNKGDCEGETALMRASEDSEVHKLRRLLMGGANVDAVDYSGRTALIRACDAAVPSPKTVKELLDAGANTNHEANNGKTALFYLVSRQDRRGGTSGVEAIFNLLVGGGAGLDSKAKDGDTLLMCAARNGDSEAVHLLLAAGADPKGRDKDGRTTLMLASMSGLDSGARAVEILLDAGVDRHAHDFHGNTALMLAAIGYANPITLGLLLNAGLDPCQRFETGRTTLMAILQSCEQCHSPDSTHGVRIARELIEAGVSVDAADNEGDTALMDAAWRFNPSPSAIKILLAAGANPNLANKAGQTALMLSAGCYYYPLDKVNTLLDAGADVNAVDGHGQSALYWAVDIRHRRLRHCRLAYVVAAILRAPGVILDQKDNAGDTALVRAERNGNAYGAKLIRDAIRRRDRT